MKNTIQYRLWGRYALYTDPITKIGGEKCSYHVPTYEALVGITESIYWKPTFVWVVDRLRVLRRIRTQTKGVKPLRYDQGGNDLAIYTYLADVEYQVEAHFEWNLNRPELKRDRVDGKHYEVARRMLDRGGRRDIFLGTRECQGYAEPCEFGVRRGYYDDLDELGFGLMFHGFDYPGRTGGHALVSRFWFPRMKRGVIDFISPDECTVRRVVRDMRPRTFTPGVNFSGLDEEGILS
jgi:CRISPR-associated protein Cas5d